MRALRLLSLLLVVVLTVLAPATAAAQAAVPGGGTVVASGLNNPRLLAVAADGTIFVGESGTGGAETFTAPPPFGSGNRGMSAQLVRVAPDGTKSVVVGGLPSIALGPGGAELIGVKGVVPSGNDLLFTVGYTLGANWPTAYDTAVMRVPMAGGAATKLADIGAFEKANNPDGLAIDSNAYGLFQAQDGTIYVADAGGNTIYTVNASNGQVTRLATLGPLASPMPNPGRGNRMERDPVPTSLTPGPDGALYVSLLGGFPFSGAEIVRVHPTEGARTFASGLAPMTDLDFAPDRNIYAVEFGSFSLASQPPGWAPNSGRVVRVKPDGSKEVVISGLNQPNGISLDGQGRLYVTENSNSGPSNTTAGRVLRYELSRLTGQPYPAPAAPAAAPRPAGAPTQLPRTGDPGALLPALAGVGVLLIGWRLRQR